MKKGIFKFPIENGILECNCFFEIKKQESMCFVDIDLSNPSLEMTNKIKETYEVHFATTNGTHGYATYTMIKKNFQIKCGDTAYIFIGCFIMELKDNFIKIRAEKQI